MNRRTALTALIVAIFALNGYLLYASAFHLNTKRVSLALDLYSKSQTSSENERLLALIQSDILDPSDSKKLEIASIYLKSGSFTQANFYLRLISDSSGAVRYAESSLEEGRFEAFDNLSIKITDEKIKEELILFGMFAKGDPEALKNIGANPTTGLGKVLLAINTRKYDSLAGTGAIIQIINSQTKHGKTTAELNISKSLLEIGQNEIALFLLDRIKKENPGIPTVYLLKAKYYENKNDIKNAIASIKMAIMSNPSETSYYAEGIRLSTQASDDIEKSFFENRLKALEPLIK